MALPNGAEGWSAILYLLIILRLKYSVLMSKIATLVASLIKNISKTIYWIKCKLCRRHAANHANSDVLNCSFFISKMAIMAEIHLSLLLDCSIGTLIPLGYRQFFFRLERPNDFYNVIL